RSARELGIRKNDPIVPARSGKICKNFLDFARPGKLGERGGKTFSVCGVSQDHPWPPSSHKDNYMKKRYVWPAGAFILFGLTLGNPIQGQPKKTGEIITPPAKGERHKDSVRVGDLALDFTLPVLKDSKKEIKLSS